MTWQLGTDVVAGEIVNVTCNQVHGWLRLRGLPRPLYLHLSGNASPALAGRRAMFQGADPPEDSRCEAGEFSRLARQQIGPTGRIDLTEEPRGLILEWYGQNGRVECQVARPELLDVTEVECQAAVQRAAASPQGGWFGLASLSDLPPQRPESFEADDWSARFDVLEQALESEEEQPIGSLISPPIELPPADQMAPRELHQRLKEALGRLALLGICVDLCEHYTVRDAYQLVRDTIWWEETTHPQLARSGYLMHYLTFDHCRRCRQEEENWIEEQGRLPADEEAS